MGFVGSISAPEEATIKDEAHALQCIAAGPYNAIPTNLLCVDSVSGFGPALLGIDTLSLAARCRAASNSGTLANVPAKKKRSSRVGSRSHFCLHLRMEGEFLNPSMSQCTMEALAFVRHLDHHGKLDESPQDKKQKAVTALLRDELQKQVFSKPVSLRASRVLGPVSRFRMAQVLP